MPLVLNTAWKIRCEHFGALAVDLTGQSRLLMLNKGAALLTALCALQPRAEAELAALLPQPAWSVLRELRTRGVLVDAHEAAAKPITRDEVTRIVGQIREAPRDHLAAPFEINLYTTTRCNLDCGFCYLSAAMRRAYGPPLMDRGLLQKLLHDCDRVGIFSLAFLGGEPLIDQEALTTTLQAYRGRFLISITTNGTIPPRQELLELLAQPGVDVLVSIHSAQPPLHDQLVGQAGAWVKAIHTLRMLSACGVRTGLQMVLTHHTTEDDVLDLLAFARSLGASGFYVNNLFPGSNMSLRQYAAQAPPRPVLGRIAIRLNELRQRYGDCFYIYSKGTYGFVYSGDTPKWESPFDALLTVPADGITSLEVLSDGSVYPGLLSFHAKGEPLGNLASASVEALWNSPQLLPYRRPAILLNEPCASCAYRAFCKGGNGIVSHHLFGKRSAGDVRCPIVWDHIVRQGLLDDEPPHCVSTSYDELWQKLP